ncbi:MAG: family 78 glycoside hydrolase catalytic domain [Mycobacteriales bacterium]
MRDPETLRPGRLMTAYAARPLGIDAVRPRLRWIAECDRAGAAQTAYRVVVGRDPATLTGGGADWDTGDALSGDTSVSYGGSPLTARARRCWAVRLTDETGAVGPWSEPAWFETGLIDPADWTARWITRDLGAETAIRFTERGKETVLTPGHTLGQSFHADFPVASVSLVPWTPDQPQTSAVARLLRGGPGGDEVARKPVDHIGNGLTVWLVPESPLPGGDYYLELSEPNGEMGWWGDLAGSVPGGTAYADGVPAEGARTITVEAPAAPSPLLRKEFTIPAEVRSARLYVTGLGYHEVHLNGVRVGDAVLDPAFTAYDQRVLYNTHDVTPLLRVGGNAIGIALGRGLYGMKQPNVWTWNAAPWNAEPAAISQLEISCSDGSRLIVVSDESWLVRESATRRDMIYGGDDFDARVDVDGWTDTGYDARDWTQARVVDGPAGPLHGQELPHIKIAGEIAPVAVETLLDGARRYDFGGVTAGWARLTVAGPAGARVTVHYGEKLDDDGHVNHDNWHVEGAIQTDFYTLAGKGIEAWRPAFSYKGFRYIEISADSELTAEEVLAEPVHSAVTTVGAFDSSSDLFNWIDDATARTVVNNLHGIPTDTPYYEKNGWTADAHLIAESAIYQYDLQTFFRKWLADFRDAQQPDAGIPVIVPTGGWGTFTDPCWSGAYPLIAWNLYQFYGDSDALAEHYGPLRRYAECLRERCEKAGWLWPDFSHGDWLAPGYTLAPEGPKLAGTAFVQHTMTTMAQIADAIGAAGDATAYTALAGTVADAFNTAFLADGVYHSDKDAGYRQTNNVLPLAFEIVPHDRRAAVLANLVADITGAHGGHLDTGAIGTKYLLPTLCADGHADLALTVALQTTHPSWGYWKSFGGNTLWEAWDDDARSLDHYFLGTSCQWLREGLVGLRPVEPGFRRFEIAPVAVDDDRVTHARTTYDSVLGPIEAGWRRAGGEVVVEALVPVGARATVRLPGERRIDGAVSVEIGSGRHLLIGR